MIYVIYLLTAAIIVFLSNKASKYVDLIDKKTTQSGAFIGGIMLSAVTSLPELFTSISSTLFLNNPGLCIGNILGSDLFNVAVLALFMIFAYKSFVGAKISNSHTEVMVIVSIAYIVIILNKYNFLSFDILTVSITSIILLLLYALSVKRMSGENGEKDEDVDNADDSVLTLKQVVFRFILTSIGIVIFSVVITFITDEISLRLNLGAGLAGALFLGIATSLPEVSSTVALFKLKNYNIAVGNIVGSNIFNLIILSLADLISFKALVYDFADMQTSNLLIFGAIAMILTTVALRIKNKAIRIIAPVGIIICYVAFLTL